VNGTDGTGLKAVTVVEDKDEILFDPKLGTLVVDSALEE